MLTQSTNSQLAEAYVPRRRRLSFLKHFEMLNLNYALSLLFREWILPSPLKLFPKLRDRFQAFLHERFNLGILLLDLNGGAVIIFPIIDARHGNLQHNVELDVAFDVFLRSSSCCVVQRSREQN